MRASSRNFLSKSALLNDQRIFERVAAAALFCFREISLRNGRVSQSDALTAVIEARYVKPSISAIYPLEQINVALKKNKEGHTRGKIVIEIP